jgi:predicted RNase H-like HicB family nuclease
MVITVDRDNSQTEVVRDQGAAQDWVAPDTDAMPEGSVMAWELIENRRRYRVLAIVSKEEDDGFTSESPSLPGAVSQGTSVADALNQLKEAIAGCIESYDSAREPIPWVQDPSVENVEHIAFSGWIDVDV